MGNAGFSNGRLTINGRPTFVLGVYDSTGGYSPDEAFWEERIFSPSGPRGLAGMPINAFLNYWWGNVPIDSTRAMLNVLHRHGVHYLQTGNAFEDGSWRRLPFSISSREYVQAFAQHPASLGFYIADEAAESLITETEEHHRELKAWAPNLVTFAALMAGVPKGSPAVGDPAKWLNAADVLGSDPYPVYAPPSGPPPQGYAHFAVGDYISKLRAAVPADRPVWAVLQLFKGTTNARMPTPEEMRYHAVASIVDGAQGIWWWEIGQGLRRAGTTEQTAREYMGHLRDLVTELAALEPALLAEPIMGVLQNSTTFPDPVAGRIAQLQHNVKVEWLYSRVQWYKAEIAALQAGDHSKSGGMLTGAATIRTRASVANGQGYVFAYNYTNARVPVTFNVPGAEAFAIKVRENKSGQTFPVVGASWSDTFGPYQARIYIISV